MNGQVLDNGTPMDPRMVAALEAQQEQIQRQQDAIPNKGEQRRLASVQFAIQSRPAGFDNGGELIKVATLIDKYISSGPNS